MAPIWYIIPICIAIFIIWAIDYKKKHGTYGVPKSKPYQVIRPAKLDTRQSVVEISNNDYERVMQFKADKGLNKTFKFELTGLQNESSRAFFRTGGHEYMPVEIVAEPENPFDENAYAVKYNRTLLGYVPADTTRGVKAVLGDGVTQSYIFKLNKRFDSASNREWINVKIGIDYYFPPLDATATPKKTKSKNS